MPGSISPISLGNLKAWIDEGREFALVDTARQELFGAQHLPKSQNACVFEVNFLDQVRSLRGIEGQPGNQTIVVYGASERSLASATAAEKLAAVGYTNIHDFRGGLEAWRNAGLPMEGTGATVPDARDATGVEDRTYTLDPAASRLVWTGRSLTGRHSGTITVASGEIEIRNGNVMSGSVVLDMDSMKNTDIPDPSLSALLIAHLKSDDFFDVAKFPVARFTFDSFEALAGSTPGTPNYRVHGDLQLKDVVRVLDFPAEIGRTEDGCLVAQAAFDIDRTLWNVRYGSGKFYENLGKHLVSDIISIDLKVVAC